MVLDESERSVGSRLCGVLLAMLRMFFLKKKRMCVCLCCMNTEKPLKNSGLRVA